MNHSETATWWYLLHAEPSYESPRYAIAAAESGDGRRVAYEATVSSSYQLHLLTLTSFFNRMLCFAVAAAATTDAIGPSLPTRRLSHDDARLRTIAQCIARRAQSYTTQRKQYRVVRGAVVYTFSGFCLPQ